MKVTSRVWVVKSRKGSKFIDNFGCETRDVWMAEWWERKQAAVASHSDMDEPDDYEVVGVTLTAEWP